jgi:hypothetical protein
LLIGDVAADEVVAVEPGQVRQVPGVRELVQHHDLRAGEARTVAAQQAPDELRSDEAGAAGDHDPHPRSRTVLWSPMTS